MQRRTLGPRSINGPPNSKTRVAIEKRAAAAGVVATQMRYALSMPSATSPSWPTTITWIGKPDIQSPAPYTSLLIPELK